MHPIKLLRPAGFVFIVLVCLPFVPCPAQDKPSAEAVQRAPADSNIISIDFPGGPLSKLMASIDTGREARLSIIQTGGLDPNLPAFSVHHAPIDAILVALMRLLEPQGYSLSPTGFNLAVLTKNENMKVPAFASFQLENKLGTQSVDEVIAAIQAGCEFASEDNKPSTLRFKYHPGTKLLFVAGTAQEVDVATRVYGSLPGGGTKALPPPPSDKK